jgi:uncharacterized protein YbaP (TraB family)
VLPVLLLFCLPRAAAAGEAGLFLWQARSDAATVYLLGSMHAAKAEFYPLDRAIQQAWQDSPALAVEVNLDTVDMGALQQELLSRGMYGVDESLQAAVSKETWDLLKSYLESRGLNTAGFGSMKPWFLSLVLTVTEMARAGYQEQYGIDRHFLDLAGEQGKPVYELESGDYQLELLSGFDERMQELFLVSTLRELEDFPSRMGEMVSAWTSGDTAVMERLISESAQQDKRLEAVLEKLVFQRNEAMTQKVAGYLREGKSCFVVVGAAHLVGRRGIIELLSGMDSATGKVTRVAPAGSPAAGQAPALEPTALPSR